jgi:hypothetical protein
MISSKILVQSAAAGLMAGAILTSPLFLCGPDDWSYKTGSCPYANFETNQQRVNQQRTSHQYAVHVEPAVIRAAPTRAQRRVDSRRGDKQLRQRSIEQRNQAANQALQQINVAYHHSDAEKRGAQTAHSVILHGEATQTARLIGLNANVLAKCGNKDRLACLRFNDMLREHGPLLSP